MSGGNNDLLALCYGLIALLYIVHAGVNLPGYIDDWLHKNHDLILILLAAIYSCISLLYLYSGSNQKHHDSERGNHPNSLLNKILDKKNIVLAIFITLISYSLIVHWAGVKSISELFYPISSSVVASSPASTINSASLI